MENSFGLVRYGAQLWAREKGRQVRGRLRNVLDELAIGDVLVVDLAGVEAFDFCFTDEFFGKVLLTLGTEYPGRFLIVENLNDCTREDLAKGLESVNLAIMERKKGKLILLGKVHPTDRETFEAVVDGGAVSAAVLSAKLNVNLTAMNERLSKLTNLSLVRREKGSSASGREQYMYQVLR